MAYPSATDGPQVVFPLPVGACLRTSGFGPRIHPTTRRPSLHAGVDFGAPEGTPILCFAEGQVVDGAPDDPHLGSWVAIEHRFDGVRVVSLYAHMRPADVKVAQGQVVHPGDVVGLVGSSGRTNGPHLHFELHVGRDATPTDPEVWVDRHAAWASAAWRIVPTTGPSRRRRLRRGLTRLI